MLLLLLLTAEQLQADRPRYSINKENCRNTKSSVFEALGRAVCADGSLIVLHLHPRPEANHSIWSTQQRMTILSRQDASSQTVEQ